MQCNIYRIMLEPEAFLQSSGRRRLKSEFIIRLNAPFHCFRTSRSLLWPLKSNSRPLFIIMTPFFYLSGLLFHSLKIITCSKRKDALVRHMSSVISRYISHTDYDSAYLQATRNKQTQSNVFINNNNNFSICIAFASQRKINSCTFIIIYTKNVFAHTLLLNCFVLHFQLVC